MTPRCASARRRCRPRGSSHDVALSLAEYTLGVALLYRDAAADRPRGLDLMVGFREFVRERAPFMVPVVELLSPVRGPGAVTAMLPSR